MEKITLAAIQEDYINAYSRYQQLQDVLQQKIKIRTKQIERLQHKLTRHGGNFPRWTENLLRPVLNRVKEQLPGWIADDGQLTPMGLGCRVSVFFIRLTIIPNCKPGTPRTISISYSCRAIWIKGNCYTRQANRTIVLPPAPSGK
ncbi:hypothetical protein ACFJIV_28935 [Mucilaginibacter sp. UC70_90]